jgi:Ca2+/Na+ antiporter
VGLPSIEAIWSSIAAIGFLFSVWAAGDGWLDFGAVREEIRRGHLIHRGPRWWIAVGNLIGSGAWAFAWLLGLAIGFMAITRVRVESIGWVLVAMFLLLAAIQVWNRYARRKVSRAVSHGRA